ncbi:lysophospholipid acyltransferase family protein [Aliamphritea hakodatensis]|uniref:lysophospholipid acyltransferase family protein n=1 Tax=Aliamphritea hakodatensis TaxID=2895352 RepID=UPI0022FD6A51|nr:lysophospholipid acyltransferase family protein [Aliamphritea hakodatensis]
MLINRIIKILFFALLVKPVVLILLGLNVRGRPNLPDKGPAILVANHNSHLDTLVLMSLYPLSQIHRIRPVAAADYFLQKGGFLAWLALTCIGIIPMDRSGSADRDSLFKGCHEALDNDQILILFPEGSRGQPEQMSKIKKGVFYVLKERPDTKVIPVMLHGLGRALPRNEALFVPFNCDVIIGEEIPMTEKSPAFVAAIAAAFEQLSEYCITQNQL